MLNKIYHGKVLHYTTIGFGDTYPYVYFQSVETWKLPMFTYSLLRRVILFFSGIVTFLRGIEDRFTVEVIGAKAGIRKGVKING